MTTVTQTYFSLSNDGFAKYGMRTSRRMPANVMEVAEDLRAAFFVACLVPLAVIVFSTNVAFSVSFNLVFCAALVAARCALAMRKKRSPGIVYGG